LQSKANIDSKGCSTELNIASSLKAFLRVVVSKELCFFTNPGLESGVHFNPNLPAESPDTEDDAQQHYDDDHPDYDKVLAGLGPVCFLTPLIYLQNRQTQKMMPSNTRTTTNPTMAKTIQGLSPVCFLTPYFTCRIARYRR
jgi:hypothetical protein